jgi:hypothetical protein
MKFPYMKALIIEDEPLIAKELQNKIKAVADAAVSTCQSSGRERLKG